MVGHKSSPPKVICAAIVYCPHYSSLQEHGVLTHNYLRWTALMTAGLLSPLSCHSDWAGEVSSQQALHAGMGSLARGHPLTQSCAGSRAG